MTILNTSVKFFTSSMSGAPALSGTAGTLIGVLDACLVSGFGSVTLNSLVITDNVATGTVSTGHNLAMVGNAGPVITIAGATPSGLNGEWRIASVPDSTTFTFATSGISNQTATGTITAIRSPAGFTKVYSGTNKAAYQANSVASTRLYLRVDDTPAQYPVVLLYETMSDVDTGTGRTPTGTTNLYFGKSSASSSTARTWRLYADDQCFYLFGLADGTNYLSGFFFGDIVKFLSADAYHCSIIAHPAASNAHSLGRIDNTNSGAYLARAYTQVGSALAMGRYSIDFGNGSVGYGGPSTPNPVDNAFHAWPILVVESSAKNPRGILPGAWNALHNTPSDGLTVTDIPQLPGRTLFVQPSSFSSDDLPRFAFDIMGPWR